MVIMSSAISVLLSQISKEYYAIVMGAISDFVTMKTKHNKKTLWYIYNTYLYYNGVSKLDGLRSDPSHKWRKRQCPAVGLLGAE